MTQCQSSNSTSKQDYQHARKPSSQKTVWSQTSSSKSHNSLNNWPKEINKLKLLMKQLSEEKPIKEFYKEWNNLNYLISKRWKELTNNWSRWSTSLRCLLSSTRWKGMRLDGIWELMALLFLKRWMSLTFLWRQARCLSRIRKPSLLKSWYLEQASFQDQPLLRSIKVSESPTTKFPKPML